MSSPPRSENDTWSDIDSEKGDEELAIEAKRALAYLQNNRNYRYVEFLAQGGYGWVALVYDDEKSRSLAIKCTSDTSEMELSWWPRLDHKNILPLLEYITLDTCTIFIMPAMRKDIWMVVNESRFYEEELSFGLCRIWLQDVARALDYLHGQFLCHLDLKLDNVFLKPDGYACLGDFSLLSDIREVPEGFHFLEIYEPPEFTQWCHGTPPESIASATKFGGDKADMWQYGILTVDLLTNLKLTGNKDSKYTLFHHDVWPFLEKILLHEEYLSFLLEDTFVNVVFQRSDFSHCYDFIKNIVCLDPQSRMSAESALKHAFVDVPWPQLPREFTLPKVIVEHLPEPKPLPIEEIKDSEMTPEEALATALEEKKEDAPKETPSVGALDVMKRKMQKMHLQKLGRRETIFIEAGKKPLEIKSRPSLIKKKVKRKRTPWPQTKPDSEGKRSGSEDESKKREVKTSKVVRKTRSGGHVAVSPVKKSKTSGSDKTSEKKSEKSSDKGSK